MLCLFEFFFSACEKQKQQNLVPHNIYFPLAIGNIWYYQLYKIDSNGDKKPFFNSLDSMYIIGDTIVNDLHYFRLISNTCIVGACVSDSSLVRQSGDKIVNQNGGVVLASSISAQTLFSDTNSVNTQLFITDYCVPSLSDTILTNLGQYTCLNWEGTVRMEMDTVVEQRPNIHYYFATDIGLVQHQFYNITGNTPFFRELVAYQLN